MLEEPLPVEGLVQRRRGHDEREVGERLREVAELFPTGADLLGVQSITPWDDTRAAVCRSPMSQWSAMGG
jgi:hypothetical protein